MAGWGRMLSFLGRIEERQIETERRAKECETGRYAWYCDFRPHAIANKIKDKKGNINGQQFWRWTRYHRKERFYLAPRSLRPLCGAKTRSGGKCKARVCERSDGTLAARCRLHGGLSTGPKNPRTKENANEVKQKLILALLEGYGVVESCKMAGVSPTTVYRWQRASEDFNTITNEAYQIGTEKREQRQHERFLGA